MTLSFDPAVVLALGLAIGLYARAVRILRGRGWRVGTVQQVAWYSGVALLALGMVSPIDALGHDLLSAHMVQHLLIADLAAPLLLIGLRTPVLVFFLPRPALVALARREGLRRIFRFLRRPLVAVPIWIVSLYGWHVPAMFEGALADDLLHALQHQAFIGASLLVWWSVIEPKHARIRPDLWKGGYVIGARVAGMFLGMAFLLMLRTPLYSGGYGDRAAAFGLTPLVDQQIAGALMLAVDLALMLGTLGFFFYAADREDDRTARRAATVAG